MFPPIQQGLLVRNLAVLEKAGFEAPTAQPVFRQQNYGLAAFCQDTNPFIALSTCAAVKNLYMEKFLKFRQLLEENLCKVESAMAQADAAAGTVMLDQSSVGRLSRMDAMQQQAMAAEIRGRLASQKLKIKSALDRIATGTYGLCCECEVELDVERLRGEPAAVFCRDCAAERESHRNWTRET